MEDLVLIKRRAAGAENSPEEEARLFGRWVRELRKAAGKTQEQLSQEVDISRNYLSQIERGLRANLSWGVQERLETYFQQEYALQQHEPEYVAVVQVKYTQASTNGSREEVARSLGHEVRTRRVTYGITQEELAEQVGVSRSYLSQIERGLRTRLSSKIRRRLVTFVFLGTAQDLKTVEEGANLPTSLSVFARRAQLSLDEVSMLAKIRYQGRQPDTPEKWETLYNAVTSVCTE